MTNFRECLEMEYKIIFTLSDLAPEINDFKASLNNLYSIFGINKNLDERIDVKVSLRVDRIMTKQESYSFMSLFNLEAEKNISGLRMINISCKEDDL